MVETAEVAEAVVEMTMMKTTKLRPAVPMAATEKMRTEMAQYTQKAVAVREQPPENSVKRETPPILRAAPAQVANIVFRQFRGLEGAEEVTRTVQKLTENQAS